MLIRCSGFGRVQSYSPRATLLSVSHSQRRTWAAAAADERIFNHRAPAPQQGDPVDVASSSAKGPLARWEVSVKDNICTSDMPTTCSSRTLQGYTSPFDATVVRLLRQAGARIVGKTNCDEFGMGSANIHSAFGPVVNPVSVEEQGGKEARVAGGSSGGAAASVAAKMCRVAIGSDTGGSVRLPAAYCGVYGLKPSYGLLSRWGLVSYADSLDTIGLIASNARDIQSTFEVLSKYDEKDPTSIPDEVRRRAEELTQESLSAKGMAGRGSLTGFRIGVPQEFFASEVSERVLPAVRACLSTFRTLGADIVPVHLDSAKFALSAYYVLASAEASSNLARYDGIRFGQRVAAQPSTPEHGDDTRTAFARHIAQTRSEMFGNEVQKRLLLGTYALTSDLFDNYFVQAQRVRQLVRRDFDKAFCIANALSSSSDGEAAAEPARETLNPNGVHALVYPSAVDIAPTLSEAQSSGLTSYTQDVLNVPASLAGIPAITVPIGKADGMPVGVTLASQWGCESVLWRLLEHVGT